MKKSVLQRNSPFRANPGSGGAILRDDEDRSEFYTLVESRFEPVHLDYNYNDHNDYDEEYYHRPRRADNYYGIRQEYLRSYIFTREDPKPEKMKDSLKRFKAAVWAVLCCKYKSSQAKALRSKLSSRSSRFLHESTDYLSASCRKITVPSCIRFSSLDVA